MYGIFCFIGLAFVLIFVKETKGKSAAEIARLYYKGRDSTI